MAINPKTYAGLDALGRVALSPNFFLREFLYSEVSQHYGVANIPTNVDLAIEAGRGLCENLLEPLNATFGRVAIRSGYRSRELNDLCHEREHNCSSSDASRARHLWDEKDDEGRTGATATIVVPWFWERFEKITWQAMAWWIHDHLPYSDLAFFSNGTFNITWSTKPKKYARSRYGEVQVLETTDAESAPGLHGDAYRGFPELRRESPRPEPLAGAR